MKMRSAAAVPSNRSIDTDVLSAGFARLLSAGHLQRYTDANGSTSLASAAVAQAPRLPRVLQQLEFKPSARC
jgi:hypothetical protein